MAAQIKPFKAVRYNQDKVNLEKVVCPPYDVISSANQERYHQVDPHNFIHILLGKDVPGQDKYQRSADYFRDWLKNDVFIQDKEEAIYFYSQEYSIKGEKRARLGFISLLHLPEKDSAVYGHENTHLAPKEDRLKLLKKVKANLSPIFAVFLDNKRIIQRVYRQHIQNTPPFIDITDNEKTVHKLWKISSPEVISLIQSGVSGENVFIADGHHRYEVASLYRDEMKKKLDKISGQESFNYILSYFTNTDPKGLLILPIHRLLKLDSILDTEKFLASLAEYFDIEEIKDKTRFFFLMEKGGRSEHVIGMCYDNKFRLLRLKNIKILDKLISDKPPAYRCLDVAILNAIILKKVLGVDLDGNNELTFIPDNDELLKKSQDNSLSIAFFLNPVKIEQIVSLALNKERMPPKSTYFYPKVLSGLVINKHE